MFESFRGDSDLRFCAFMGLELFSFVSCALEVSCWFA